MQRLLSLRIELWAVLLILLVGFLAAIGFGFAAIDGERGAKRFGVLSETALFLAEIPDTAKAALVDQNRMQVPAAALSGKPTGWSAPGGTMPTIDGYLLFSRYDGTRRRPVVELVSMRDWQVKHLWSPDADKLLEDFTFESDHMIKTNWTTEYYRAIHPYLTDQGQLIIKDHNSPLLGLDACGARNWIIQGRIFHHSTEADADGNLWVPSVVEPTIKDVEPKFFEDVLTKVSPAGKVLFTRSVAQMMLDHGLDYLLFTNSRYGYDPIHLNDIEPVLASGPYWKKGDLFLSFRNLSMVMLYRPSTDEIVWMKQGPWIAQHDVDILDDHRIAVYNNRAEDRGTGNPLFYDHSQITVFDFATGQISTLYDAAMATERIRTAAGGLFTALPGGYGMIEDVQNGRFLIVAADGKVAAEFTNRAENGKYYQLGWSRYISQMHGDLALAAMKGVTCNE